MCPVRLYVSPGTSSPRLSPMQALSLFLFVVFFLLFFFGGGGGGGGGGGERAWNEVTVRFKMKTANVVMSAVLVTDSIPHCSPP